MKKLIIILLVLFNIQFLSSQARLGYSLNEIKEEYSQYNPKETVCEDGLNALSFQIKDLIVIYYFDKFNTCTNTLISTKNGRTALQIIKFYDENYLAIDDTSWKISENLTVAIINSYVDLKMGYVFVWNYYNNESWLLENTLEGDIELF